MFHDLNVIVNLLLQTTVGATLQEPSTENDHTLRFQGTTS